jgi:two-component system copper resistance phosphate regulon response regulator CusR
MKLLVIEDAPRLRNALDKALSRLGHNVTLASDGQEGWDLIDAVDHGAPDYGAPDYDAIVLDIMLPGLDGLTLLRRMRERGRDTPVLLLTARDAVEDRVLGLSSGADDYLIKPFAIAELAARLDALVRRRYGQRTATIQIGPITIDTAARLVTREGAPVELTARELALLEYLARRRGHVVSRAQIEEHLYAGDDSPVSNAVDSAICQLRRKISPPGTPPLIHTRRGLGYVLEAP